MKVLVILFVFFFSVIGFSQSYVASKKAKKFHLESCTHAGKISSANLISFADRDEALQKGYTGCKVCIKTTGQTTVKKKSEKETTVKPKTQTSGRCLATTKKGTQCKRNAQSGRNYCWQH